MPDAGRTHGPPATRTQAAVTTGSAEQPAFPARWSTAYTRSPRGTGFLAPVACTMPSIVADLTPASRHQDHAISPSASMLLVAQHQRGHRIPPHVPDDRDTPLIEAGRGIININSDKKKEKYLQETQNFEDRIDSSREFLILREPILPAFGGPTNATRVSLV